MIQIVPAVLEFAEAIAELEKECFTDPWSKSSIEYEITHKHSICVAAIREKTLLGHATMRHVINEGHINNIAVSKSCRGQGVGSLLLAGLLAEANKREMIGLTLEVRESNEVAISLYKKFGFTMAGIRKNYYSMPSEHGLVMWLLLAEGDSDNL